MTETFRGPTNDGAYPLKPGLGTTGGVNTLRATVRGRSRHNGSLQRIARDCGTGIEALEQFAFGHCNLPTPVLQALAKYLFSEFKTYDPATDALVKVERPNYVSQTDRISAETSEWFKNKPERPRYKTQMERISEETGERFLASQRSK